MNTKDHWLAAYRENAGKTLSWYQERPEYSLALIHKAQLRRDSPIIDVGGGASPFVGCLLQQGYEDLTVLDIAGTSLQLSRQRLGPGADSVHWLEQDILGFKPQRRYDLWHDRAMFHFLTEARDRQIYIDVLRSALHIRGQLILSAFTLEGPKKCSGLEVMQYDAARLSRELGEDFQLQQQEEEDHLTPAGRVQRFRYYRFRLA